ncbi:MAG: DUF484 family protein [Methylophaga sp.]|uniref:DUF484 family protein n=1 Tax=Methylophaga sp. TaxID=2024840 RepID=UPI000C0E115C|nr:DUF484 family protein [Methylophaga sp.]MBL1456530.1 DUF484 family protein [Methylophaga sp.]
MGNTQQSVSAEQVSEFLRQHTDFLIDQPDLLSELEFENTPEGTISLAQRQRQQLRQKNQHLHEQLHALIDNAHSNAALQQRVHQLCLRLMDCQDMHSLLATLMQQLQQEFSADEVSLRLFYSGDQKPKLPPVEGNIVEMHADDSQLKAFDHILGKQLPVCGRLTKAQKQLLFGDKADEVHSVACLPLGHEPCAGLLAIASSDANRFHADMGTEYLSFLGEVFMRLLRRFCHGQNDS